jgi:hypothetical protein
MTMQTAELLNPRAVIGGNNPPEPTPFDLSRDEIEGLFEEAKNWLDGEGVQTQADADGVGQLLDAIRKAAKAADDRRKDENKLFDEGKAAVQAKYAPLIADTKSERGKAVLAAEACKKALAPFLEKVEAEKRRIAEEARRKADEERAAAEAAIRAARASDLEAQEAAERQLREAQAAEAAAKRAENDRAQAKGGARAVSLRSTWTVEMADIRDAAAHYWRIRPDEFRAFLIGVARQDVAAGKREIPGFTITEQKVAV